jgi:hypothetical protein
MRVPVTLTLLAVFVFGAQAYGQEADNPIEWTAKGSLRVRGFMLASDTRLDPPPVGIGDAAGDDSVQTFLDTRLRLSLRATAYGEASAFFAIEVGDIRFGDEGGGTAGRVGSDGIVFENKNLYLEWHPTRYSFKLRGGLYPRESDPYGIVLSDDVAGLHGEVELLGLNTIVYADSIKAVENSRQDLDGDGEIDNDYNDRSVFIAGLVNTSVSNLTLELFGIADIDYSQERPVAKTEANTYWLGIAARTHLGPVGIDGVLIGAYGKRTVSGGPNQRIRGLALDWRVTLDLGIFTVQGIFAWASGRDPRSSRDDAFPVIAPFYGASGIIYQDLGGFNVTGSNLSGTAHTTIKLSASPAKDLSIQAVFQWAWYTSDRDVSANTKSFNEDARDIGFETDLNVTYSILEGFSVYARGSVLFTSKGYLAQQDVSTRGTLGQVIVGAQLSF